MRYDHILALSSVEFQVVAVRPDTQIVHGINTVWGQKVHGMDSFGSDSPRHGQFWVR